MGLFWLDCICAIIVSCFVTFVFNWWMVSMANCKCCWLSSSCSFRSLRRILFGQPIFMYLQETFSYMHTCRCDMILLRGTDASHWALGQGISIMGHISRWLVVLSWYSPASLQWGHSYRRLGHSSCVCFSMSLRRSWCISLPSLHSFGQESNVKSQLVRCSFNEHSSPIHSQPLAVLSHWISSDWMCRSPSKLLIWHNCYQITIGIAIMPPQLLFYYSYWLISYFFYQQSY